MITRVQFVKNLSLVFIVFFSHLLRAERSTAQTVAVNGLNTEQNGITQGALILGQKNIVLFGFEVKVQGTSSITEINFDVSSPDNKNNYFSNYRLYRSSDQTFSADDQPVKATAAFKKNNINSLSLSDLTETFSAASGNTHSYFLVADYSSTAGEVPGSIAFGFSRKQKQDALVAGKKGFNSFDVKGKDFSISASEVTLSSQNASQNGISPALLAFGQKDAVLFGFGLKVKGVSVIDEINITATNSIETFFSNARLYRSADNVFSANDVLVSKASGKNRGNSNNKGKGHADNNILTFSDLSESFNWSPEQYYFLVADYNVNESKDQQSIQFKISDSQSEDALIQTEPERNSYNTFNISGQIFKFIRSANWVGNALSDPSNWNNPANWSGNYVPGADDVANIGVLNFVNQPTISSNITVRKIVLGASRHVTLTVDSSYTLTAGELILKSSDTSIVTTLKGKGSIQASILQVNDNDPFVSYRAARTSKLVSAVSDLTLNSLLLLSRSNNNISDAEVEVEGKISINESIQSINQGSLNQSSLHGLAGSTIEFRSSEPFSWSAVGTNDLSSEGLIRYTSLQSQIIEPYSYTDLELAGAGVKTLKPSAAKVFYLPGSLTITSPAEIAYSADVAEINIRGDIKGDGALNPGNLPVTVGGSWSNSFADKVSSTVSYDGSGDQLVAPLPYRNVKFSNGGTKTLRGPASVKESVDVGPATILNTADQLTLLADSVSFASVKPLLAGADILGKVVVQSFIKGGARGYLSLSSPVFDTVSSNKQVKAFTYIQLKKFMPMTGNGGPVNGFDEGAIANPSGATVRTYREQASPTQVQYVFPAKARDTISAGKGFFFFFRGNRNNIYNKVNPPFLTPESVVMEYTGFVNRGTIKVPLSYTNYKNEGDDGFNLVGNPYPATIDLHKLLAGTPYTKVWIQNLNNAYAVYDLNLQTGTNGASRYIIPSQAFYIQTKAPGVLSFTEDCKASDAVAPGRIMSAPGNRAALTMSGSGAARKAERVKIRLAALNSSDADETMIVFKEGSSNSSTDEDAVVLPEAKKLISSLSTDNSSLAINYLPVTKADQIVKLRIDGEKSGNYSLNVSENLLYNYSDILLKDNYVNSVTSLKNGSTYNFMVNKDLSSTFGDQRFELIFKNAGSDNSKILVSGTESSKENIVIYPNPASSNISIKLLDDSRPVQVKIYNSAGALLKKNSFTAGGVINQNIGDLPSGIYFIEIWDAATNNMLHREKFLRN